ncbi:MAG: hypothetical protein WCL53_07680 [Chloroflexota bacterium]
MSNDLIPVRNIAAKLDIRGRVALRHWNGIPRTSALSLAALDTNDRRPL